MRVLIYKRKKLINSIGGIENIICRYANYFASNGYDITLTTADNEQGTPSFDLVDSVSFTNLGSLKPGLLRKILSRVSSNYIKSFSQYNYTSNILNDYIKKNKFDLIITCGLDDSLDIVYNKKITVPHICMIHSFPEVYFKTRDKRLKAIEKEVLNKDITFQVLMPSYKSHLSKYTNSDIVVIGNSVNEVGSFDYSKKLNKIIYVASISTNKNQSLLVEAFSLIADKYKDWSVELWGEIHCVSEYDKINSIIKNNNLDKQVIYMGTTNNVESKYKYSKICAFPSLYEGFSLSLSEAMSCGLPSVGLATSPFVNEFISNDLNGLLVENSSAESFAEALSLLIENEEYRLKIGKNAQEFVKSYSEKAIMNKWCSLLNRKVMELKK